MRKFTTIPTAAWITLALLTFTVLADGGGPGGNHDDEEMHGYGEHRIEHSLILPQIAVGEHYTTTLFFSNIGSTERMPWADEEDFETSSTVFFFKQDGSPFDVMVNGAGPVSEYSFVLQSGESIALKLSGDGPDTPGWAIVETADDESVQTTWGNMGDHEIRGGMRLAATAFYSLRDGRSQLVSRVGVMPALYEREHFYTSIMAAQSGPNLDTGVAFVNTNAESVTIQLRLKDLSGKVITEATLVVAAGNQTAKFITELFPGQVPADFQGVLEVNTYSEEGVVTIGLLLAEGVLTSIPTHHFGSWNRDGMGPGGGMMGQ